MKHRQIEKGPTDRAERANLQLDQAAVKAAIDKIRQRKRPEPGLLGMAQMAKQSKLRRKLGKRLEPLIAGARFDPKRIDHALAENQAELRRALAKQKAGSAKRTAPIIDQTKKALANTRAALERIQFQPYLTTPIVVNTPYLIYGSPIDLLRDSQIARWNSWAKFNYKSDADTATGKAVASFYFAWQNNSDYLAVINCNTALLLNGIIEATADPGWLFPGSAYLELRAALTVFVGQTEINYQGTQNQVMGSIYTEAGFSEFGAPGTIQSEDIYGSYALSCADIKVDPNEVVVFEVACLATWWIDEGGSILLDFDSDAGAYQVMCPYLQVDVLTFPPKAP